MDWLTLSDAEWTAIRLSLRVSFVAMIVSLPFAIGIAMLLARGRFWGKSILNGLVHLPLILPPVVTGFLLLVLFGKRGPIGAFLAEYTGIVFSFGFAPPILISFTPMISFCDVTSERRLTS